MMNTISDTLIDSPVMKNERMTVEMGDRFSAIPWKINDKYLTTVNSKILRRHACRHLINRYLYFSDGTESYIMYFSLRLCQLTSIRHATVHLVPSSNSGISVGCLWYNILENI